MDTEKELQLQRFKIIEPFLRKEKKLKEIEEMFEKADKELYIVKQKGRNGNSIYIYEEEY